MRLVRRSVAASAVVSLAVWLTVQVTPPTPVRAAEPELGVGPFEHVVVAADHPSASRVGVEILQQGGNVVDAAVAVSFSLSVLRPEGCGIGGGGFMVIWDAEQQRAFALDYRERAPLAADREMFISREEDSNPELSRHGGLAVAVPGNVRGLSDALRRHGTLPLRAVLAPAIRLAEEGFPADRGLRNAQQAVLDDFAAHEGYAERFAPLYDLYLGGGEAIEVGERFHSPLAGLLRRIAAEGPDAFYTGEVAEAIAATVQAQGGVVSVRDLALVETSVREPLRGELGGADVYTMPPPSSGGVALLEMLNILDALERDPAAAGLSRHAHNSPGYAHLLTEAMKHAFADRAEFLGDADFADVPVDRLTSADYAAALAERIDPDRVQPLEAYGRYDVVADAGTSHFCIMDAAGNAVACTETINTLFGSYVVVPEYGIVLNNEMDDFSARPGEPNAFGLIQSDANAVEPGKKPLSSMTPTIVVEDGRAVFIAGASGGPRIISGTLQTLLNMTRHGMTPQEAVAAARFHHQWRPNTLYLEPGLLPELRRPLTALGHDVSRRDGLATVQAAARTAEGLLGGSDPRKGGTPAGY